MAANLHFSQYLIFFQKSNRNIAMSHTILIRLRRGIWKIMYNDSFLNNHTRKLRKYTYLFRKHISAIHVLHSFHVFIVLKSFSKMVTNDNPHVPGGSPVNKNLRKKSPLQKLKDNLVGPPSSTLPICRLPTVQTLLARILGIRQKLEQISVQIQFQIQVLQTCWLLKSLTFGKEQPFQ